MLHARRVVPAHRQSRLNSQQMQPKNLQRTEISPAIFDKSISKSTPNCTFCRHCYPKRSRSFPLLISTQDARLEISREVRSPELEAFRAIHLNRSRSTLSLPQTGFYHGISSSTVLFVNLTFAAPQMSSFGLSPDPGQNMILEKGSA